MCIQELTNNIRPSDVWTIIQANLKELNQQEYGSPEFLSKSSLLQLLLQIHQQCVDTKQHEFNKPVMIVGSQPGLPTQDESDVEEEYDFSEMSDEELTEFLELSGGDED